jgi:hypothetical protein
VNRRASGLVAIILVAVAVLAPVAQAKSKPTCAVKHSHTVASTKQVRVYSLKDYRDDVFKTFGHDVAYFGCDRKTGRRTTLGHAFNNPNMVRLDSVVGPRVAGRFVALEQTDGGAAGTSTTLMLADLARGQLTVIDSNPPNNNPSPPPQVSNAFYLTAHGGVAWLKGSILQPFSSVTLWARAAHAHKNVELDAGPVSKVSLHNTTLTWFSSGTRHTHNLG